MNTLYKAGEGMSLTMCPLGVHQQWCVCVYVCVVCGVVCVCGVCVYVCVVCVCVSVCASVCGVVCVCVITYAKYVAKLL